MSTAPAYSRSLRFQGVSNFRDLGGYVGQGGRQLKWRKLFRSDHLGGLTEEDRVALQALQVARVCDFRGVQERSGAPFVMAGTIVHSLPIEPTIVQRLSSLLAAGKAPGEAGTVALMQDTYRGFVRNNTPRFAGFFHHLLASDSPLVFHCTAGKDRTGFAAALVLASLGVSRDVILQDYLLTNEHLKMGATQRLPPEIAAVLYRVQVPFLAAALDAVDEDYGSLDEYLSRALGVALAEREQLGRFYLAGHS